MMAAAKPGSWRWRAANHIGMAIRKAQAEGKTGKDLQDAIDAAYPWGERKHHPYQAWLTERKAALIRLGLAESPNGKKTPGGIKNFWVSEQ